MSRFGNVRGNAVREEWGTAVEVEEGLFRIRLRNAVSGLMVNTYAYRGPSEFVVIDPGWPWTLDALEAALRDLGLVRSFVDVDAWFYTHTHIDHMGGAALLTEISDAPHYAWSQIEPFIGEWHGFQDRYNDWTEWAFEAFAEADIPEQLAESTKRRREARVEYLIEAHGEKPIKNFRPIEFDETLRIADLELRFVDARGHGPFHGAFFDEGRGWLFSGDVVLATPTPISRAMKDDLRRYLASIDRLEQLDASLLLPGHGVQRSGDLSRTFARSRGYHTAYREQVGEVLAATREPQGLLELGLGVTRDGNRFDNNSRWLAHLAIVDSHIQALREEGRVVMVDGPRYALAG